MRVPRPSLEACPDLASPDRTRLGLFLTASTATTAVGAYLAQGFREIATDLELRLILQVVTEYDPDAFDAFEDAEAARETQPAGRASRAVTASPRRPTCFQGCAARRSRSPAPSAGLTEASR